jgi:hypothetical protein
MAKQKVRMHKVQLSPGNVVDVVDERDYRKKLIAVSRVLGCEQELMQIFAKYDGLLKNCKNQKEAQAIGAMGVMEVSRLMDNGYVGLGGNITINGQVALDDSKDKRDGGSLVAKIEEEPQNKKGE